MNKKKLETGEINAFMKSISLEIKFWELELLRVEAKIFSKRFFRNHEIGVKVDQLIELLSQIKNIRNEIESLSLEGWGEIISDLEKNYLSGTDISDKNKKLIFSDSPGAAGMKMSAEKAKFKDIFPVIKKLSLNLELAMQNRRIQVKKCLEYMSRDYQILWSMLRSAAPRPGINKMI